MKKGKLAGLGNVFRFSLLEHYKSRATVVTLAIFILFAVAAPPVGAIFMGDAASKPLTPITSAYLINDTGYDVAIEGVIFTDSEENAQTSAKISCADGAYSVSVADVPGYDGNALAQALTGALYRARMLKAGATDAQLSLIGAAYDARTDTVSAFLHPERETDSDKTFAVTYAYSMLVMMLCIMSASYIIGSVVEEKASKLVELLMVSVSPLAMIVGKVLAVMCFVFTGLIGVGACFAVSCAVTGRFLDTSFIAGILGGAGLSGITAGMTLGIVLAVIVSLILGYLTFSLMAGILGVGCSSTDDMQGAVFNVMIVIMTCYIVSIFGTAFESRAAATAISLFPVLSVFCAPAHFALGNIGLGTLLISWALQAGVVCLLALVAARVYRNLILYSGNRIGLGRIIKMAKEASGREKHEKLA